MKFLDILQRIDAYPKTLEDARIKTLSGAFATLFSILVSGILIVAELRTFLSLSVTEELFVDTTRNHKLKIHLDILVPTISCDYISLDAMDSSGDQHLHIEHNVFKKRVDLYGMPIPDAEVVKEEVQSSTKFENLTKEAEVDKQLAKVTCGSCYGAQVNTTHCCNTCADVIEAYREKRWNPNMEDFVQCANEKDLNKHKEKLALKEGCQVYGSIEVNRMGGSFHLAPGRSFSINHIHVHDVQPYSSSSFNTTHTINSLSFGEQIDFANTKPLNGLTSVATEGAMMFQYYIKIVPTMYEPKSGPVTYTNQFSVTRHQKSVSVHSGESGMPGIFFSYELSPLMVKITEKSNSLGHLATNICAIIGGIFTVSGILDSVLHSSIKAIKKTELGKAN